MVADDLRVLSCEYSFAFFYLIKYLQFERHLAFRQISPIAYSITDLTTFHLFRYVL